MKKILIALGLLAVIATQSCSKSGYGCKSNLGGGGTYRHHGYYAKP